jgi:PAS domain S-box-containing protein
MKRRLQFETLMADCAARFTVVTLPSDLEHQVEGVLDEVATLFAAERCALVGGSPSAQLSWVTCATGRAAPWPDTSASFADAFPWLSRNLCATSGAASVLRLSDAPPDVEDWQSARSLGVESMLTVAVHPSAGNAQCLVLQSTHAHEWPVAYEPRLVVLAQVLVNALNRQRLEHTRQLEIHHVDVLESVGAVVWRADARTLQTTFVSREVESILGYPVESWIKIPNFWLDHIHPDDRAWVEAYTGDAIRAGRRHDFEYRMVVGDNKVIWLRNIVKVVVEHGEPVSLVGATVNVTDRKRAEFEAAQLRDHLIRAMRATNLGELTATLAHELNQPLGALLSNAETALISLDQAPSDTAHLRDILADIARDAKRAGDIIHRVREPLLQQQFEMRPVELGELVNAVVDLARPLAHSRRIEIGVNLEPNLVINVDAVQIQQMLLNLLFNAIDAVREQPESQRRIVVSGRGQGASVEVSVTDRGRGVPADALPRVFEPFFTTRVGGIGMGLAICRSIVEAHGGSIVLENDADGGATARVTLNAPATQDEHLS